MHPKITRVVSFWSIRVNYSSSGCFSTPNSSAYPPPPPLLLSTTEMTFFPVMIVLLHCDPPQNERTLMSLSSLDKLFSCSLDLITLSSFLMVWSFFEQAPIWMIVLSQNISWPLICQKFNDKWIINGYYQSSKSSKSTSYQPLLCYVICSFLWSIFSRWTRLIKCVKVHQIIPVWLKQYIWTFCKA